ncbi:zinc-binding dehydrogenase [Arthrobacter sp. AFG20]|uniref:zinc-binding dehydrogenase n=1 Tax=Arthrobacter sp. AFG20 TaxID=1688671 RepID=UPI000C9EBCE0|nr:zinc-binding dehydrogenase [Arthrobacter sp. AFG20]PNH78165.1 Zn-dependent oxidoreductase [Arthrobacter sp. AFG20]
MKAIYCNSFSPDRPLDALQIGERPEPAAAPGWTTVSVRAAALNGHDLWSLQGVGLSERDLPRILGSDAAGVDENGHDVIIYPVISSPGSDQRRALDPATEPLLSERHDGTLAERVTVPLQNVLPKPDFMTYEQAASLPTAWLTAYRMLFVQADLEPGATVLVQGASGGVSSALLALGNAAGFRMWATGRTEEKRAYALEHGAEQAFESGARLPERVEAVMETVGEATWSHSMKVLRPGGTIVVAGATTGPSPSADLQRLFFLGLRIVGTRVGTLAEMRQLLAFCTQNKLAPSIDSVYPLDQGRNAFERLQSGRAAGKIVLTVG